MTDTVNPEPSEKPVEALKEYSRLLPLTALVPSKTNPRKWFNPVKLNELSASIRADAVEGGDGVIQPLMVRLIPNPDGIQTFEIVAGERRYRAAKLAELFAVPCLVRNLTDKQVLRIQIIENIQRDDLNAMEEANGFAVLVDQGGYTRAKDDDPKTQVPDVERIAAEIGKSESYVYQRLQMARNLVPDAAAAVADGKLPASHAIEIARLEPKEQIKALRFACPEDGNLFGPVSFRELMAYLRPKAEGSGVGGQGSGTATAAPMFDVPDAKEDRAIERSSEGNGETATEGNGERPSCYFEGALVVKRDVAAMVFDRFVDVGLIKDGLFDVNLWKNTTIATEQQQLQNTDQADANRENKAQDKSAEHKALQSEQARAEGAGQQAAEKEKLWQAQRRASLKLVIKGFEADLSATRIKNALGYVAARLVGPKPTTLDFEDTCAIAEAFKWDRPPSGTSAYDWVRSHLSKFSGNDKAQQRTVLLFTFALALATEKDVNVWTNALGMAGVKDGAAEADAKEQVYGTKTKGQGSGVRKAKEKEKEKAKVTSKVKAKTAKSAKQPTAKKKGK